jgi:hypothetical protein
MDEQEIMKPTGKLFENIPDSLYRKAFAMLQDARRKHPSSGGIGSMYRDDELLMHILCRFIGGLG